MAADDGSNLKDEIERARQQLSGSDMLLRVWVDIANESDSEIGMTLSVGGTLVSGMLTGVTNYVDGTVDALEEATGQDFGELRRILLHESDSESPQLPDDLDDATDEEILADLRSTPQYIHLRRARVFTPGGSLPSNQTVFWRSRLDRVDGWFFGTLIEP